MMKINNLNKKACKTCEGACCKKLPGCLFPNDLNIVDKQSILSLIKTGNYSIDYWETEEQLYFLRPATVEGKGILLDPSWGGTCVFLGANGCTLSNDSRPYGCRILEPEENSCDAHDGGKHESAIAWEPFRSLFVEILEEYGE